jgi:ariadne-1
MKRTSSASMKAASRTSSAVFSLARHDSVASVAMSEMSSLGDWAYDDMAEDIDSPTSVRACQAAGNRYVALTAEDIGLEQQKLITSVQDLTEVEGHVARQLLQEMKWNYEALAELYYEDTDKLLAKAGIAEAEEAVGKRAPNSASGLQLDADGSFTCQVCFDTFEEAAASASVCLAPTCGHAMCKGCWFQQVKTKIIDEGLSARIGCPGFSMVDGKVVRCNIILDERFIGTLLKDVEEAGEEPDAQRTRACYHKQLNDNYVNNNQCIKWCPATDCTSAVRITDDFDKNSYRTEVFCSGGHPWCFVCMDEPHAPADCSQVKDWRKKCAEDKASCAWLVQNTKDCPKCNTAINKDGGCNHMHCRQCDHHFCWVCLGPFEHRTYQHTCNKFVQDASTTESRAALQRYAHHYQVLSRSRAPAPARALSRSLAQTLCSDTMRTTTSASKTTPSLANSSPSCRRRRSRKWTRCRAKGTRPFSRCNSSRRPPTSS